QNTLESVELAYAQGVSTVEVDVQLTRDGRMALLHNDFLSDFTCVNSLTLEELNAILPYRVPSLDEVLELALEVNRDSKQLTGILIVELKALSPHCDPGDSMESQMVTTTLAVIRSKHMSDAVIIDSFSPALLWLAKQQAPEIPRELDFALLQL